jgi:hypothetical protein
MVIRRTAMFGGRTERVLAIDGDYLHIMPAENKSFFDSVKTVRCDSIIYEVFLSYLLR